MNEIVVAIDFSSCSINALKYAIQIANVYEANITLIHVCKPGSSESVYPDTTSIHLGEARRRFEQIAKDFSGQLKGKLSYQVREGKVYKEIVNEAKYNEAIMLIAGTHGISGFEEFFIGSNAYRLVTAAPCPMITIRTMFQKEQIRRILCPIDHTSETRQKVTQTIDLALRLNAEVYVVGIYDTPLKDIRKKINNYAKQVQDIISMQGVPTLLDFAEGKKISSIILDYTRIHDIDMIAMMSERDPTTVDMFLGSEAQRVINHSPVPVLSIHPKATSSSSVSFSGT